MCSMDNLTDKHACNDDMLHMILHWYSTNTSCFWNNVGKKNTEKVNSQKRFYTGTIMVILKTEQQKIKTLFSITLKYWEICYSHHSNNLEVQKLLTVDPAMSSRSFCVIQAIIMHYLRDMLVMQSGINILSQLPISNVVYNDVQRRYKTVT